MNKRDGLLLGAAVIAALIWILVRVFSSPAGEEAVISVDGKESAVCPLGADTTMTVSGAKGLNNILEIRDGKVRVVSADCPDRLCVRQGAISREGETIVCLPNRVVITIRGGETGEIDATAY